MGQSPRAWFDPRRWPPIVVFIIAMVVVYVISGVVASIGIRLAGSMEAWNAAMSTAGPALLGWRILFYGGIVGLWLKLWKPRVLAGLTSDDDGGAQARHKLKRLEYAALGFVVLLELINVVSWLGGS
ncbi:hypothetical protein [Vreelandella olivaria]|uniref:hypothetical protein n=1 Tax=Vreelandella olivaria TaxID=390919 RepID=UPI00201F2792|nr:hypothetical protein [Halomonas olivaria]